MTWRHRIDLSYDGSTYAGWQVQPESVTIQGTVEEVLHRLNGRTVKIHASGRTDQGVHARRQVLHTDLDRKWDALRLRRAMNALLPPDIRVIQVRHVSQNFHARRSVKVKEYRYFIWNEEILSPFLRQYRLHVRHHLDLDAMRHAAKALSGTQDFASFTANPNRLVESTIRRVDAIDVRRRGAEVIVVARGEGFLYKMVRSLVGFLVRVGEGKIPREDAQRILLARRRTAHVETAPPQGLFLWNVRY
jgi:tRNA pseudouridine38-40 synthase